MSEAAAADEEEGALPDEDLSSSPPPPSSDLCTLLIENIEYPANADVYYKAAMKNAFETLSGYAVSIGAEGPQFLKHLFAYYILGQSCTNEIRSRLRPEDGPPVTTPPVILRPRPTAAQQQTAAYPVPHIRSKKRRRATVEGEHQTPLNDIVVPLENVPSTTLVAPQFTAPDQHQRDDGDGDEPLSDLTDDSSSSSDEEEAAAAMEEDYGGEEEEEGAATSSKQASS